MCQNDQGEELRQFCKKTSLLHRQFLPQSVWALLSRRIQFENELLPSMLAPLPTLVGTCRHTLSFGLACLQEKALATCSAEDVIPRPPKPQVDKMISILHGPEIAVAANSCVALSVTSCKATILFLQCMNDSMKTIWENKGPGGCLCLCTTSIHEYHEFGGIKHQSSTYIQWTQ